MKKIKPNWGYWKHLSDRNRQREFCGKGCDCQTLCDCEFTEFEKYQRDFLYESKYMNPSCKAVNWKNSLVLNEQGVLMGPYTFQEWYNYSWEL